MDKLAHGGSRMRDFGSVMVSTLRYAKHKQLQCCFGVFYLVISASNV